MSNQDGDMYGKQHRRSDNDVPPEVKHSLDLLDTILGEFETEADIKTSPSIKRRNIGDIPQEVRQSLEVLDSILYDIEHENPPPDYRHFQNTDVRTLDKKNRHDDIRRSIEVLDSVLAEFDDCLESWDSPEHFEDDTYGKSRVTDINSNTVKPSLSGPTAVQFGCLNASKDGSTSHLPSDIVPEQSRLGSPPPIPKRSPATKLSDVSLFTFPPNPCDSQDSHDSDLSPNHVSQQRIRPDTLSDNGGDKCRGDKCANCGRGLLRIAMEQRTEESSISPFHQRKQMFEAKIAEANKSPSLNKSYGTSFKRTHVDAGSDLSNVSDESGFSELSSSRLSEVSDSVSPKVTSKVEGQNSSMYHGAKCRCKERIRQLNAKFADVRRLLKLNKIRGLNKKPPSFVPPPPPISNTSPQQDKSKSTSNSLLKVADIPKTSTNDSSMDYTEVDESLRSISSSVSSLADFKLCNRCTSSLSIHTIEDLPKLLPTDALNRPHLGFSYSMEEDLPPGVKEIRQTSTSKGDVTSSPKLYRNKESNLSTFSHSANSLGYISSQSDLELNDLSAVPDKVPMSSFKSRTLPNGLDRSPFYSAEEDTFDHEMSGDSRLKSHHKSTILERTPAPQPPEKTKTKHFRVFSRKTKKEKKKNGEWPAGPMVL